MSTSAATFVKEDCSSPISIPAHWKILGEIVFPESHPSSIQKYATGRVLASVEFPETRPNRTRGYCIQPVTRQSGHSEQRLQGQYRIDISGCQSLSK